jgi:hypothetical protein
MGIRRRFREVQSFDELDAQIHQNNGRVYGSLVTESEKLSPGVAVRKEGVFSVFPLTDPETNKEVYIFNTHDEHFPESFVVSEEHLAANAVHVFARRMSDSA